MEMKTLSGQPWGLSAPPPPHLLTVEPIGGPPGWVDASILQNKWVPEHGELDVSTEKQGEGCEEI